jgi:hypothetical protein
MYRNGANADLRITEVVDEVNHKVLEHCWRGLREAAQTLGMKEMNANTWSGKHGVRLRELLEEAEALLIKMPPVAERGDD